MDRKKDEIVEQVVEEKEEEPIRLNGFERPFHPLQVVSWVVFGVDVISFCVFVIPLIRAAIAKLAVATSFAVSVGVLVLSTVKATGKDPADPHIRLQDMQLKNEDDGFPFCTMCNTSVYPSSKHCRACNKCINSFDHHCMWLNNCIGQRNYRAFIVCISSVAVMTGIVLGTCVYLIKQYFDDEGVLEPRLEDGFLIPGMPTEAVLSILIIMSVVNLPLLTLDTQLLILHIFLASQNLTTYEYIMNKCTDEDEADELPSHLTAAESADTCSALAASSDMPHLAARDVVATEAPEVTTRSRGWRRLKGMKKLPKCMDWIATARCGKRRRSLRKDKIEHIEIEAASQPPAAKEHGHDRSVVDAPTPPGSTIDPLDCDNIAPAAAAGQQQQQKHHQQQPPHRVVSSPSPSEPSIIGASPRSPREEATGASLSARSGGKDAEVNETLPGLAQPGIAARVGCGSLTDTGKTGQSQSAASLAVASV